MSSKILKDCNQSEIAEYSNNEVTLRVNEDQNELLAYWAASGLPDINNTIFTLKKDETQANLKLEAHESDVNINFIGDDSMNKNSKYYLGVREGNEMHIHPAFIYKMMPKIEVDSINPLNGAAPTPLTAKEQLDEMKEKFGSRRTQKSLATKRKFAIHFGDDDVDGIESEQIPQNRATESKVESRIGSTEILPPQHTNALSVDDVYKIEDIIIESERNVIETSKEQLFEKIKNEFVKSFVSAKSDTNRKVKAIYLDLLLQMIHLKAVDLRKDDPLPEIENEELKSLLFERYFHVINLSSNRSRFAISEKERDRMLIYCMIITLMLNNYKPLELDSLQTRFKTRLKQLRKVAEIIGCYFENYKNADGLNKKSIVLRIPLNSPKEPTKKRKRFNYN